MGVQIGSMALALVIAALLLIARSAEGGSLSVEKFQCIPMTDRDVAPWITASENNGMLTYSPVSVKSKNTVKPSLTNAELKQRIENWDKALEGTWVDRGKLAPGFTPKDKNKYQSFTKELVKELITPITEKNQFQSANIIGEGQTQIEEGLGDCQVSTSIGEKSIKVSSVAKMWINGKEYSKEVDLKLKLFFMKMTVCKTATIAGQSEELKDVRRQSRLRRGTLLGEGFLPGTLPKNPPRPSGIPTTGVFTEPTSMYYVPKEDDPVRVTKCEVKQAMLGLYGCKTTTKCSLKQGKPSCNSMYVPCMEKMKKAFASFM